MSQLYLAKQQAKAARATAAVQLAQARLAEVNERIDALHVQQAPAYDNLHQLVEAEGLLRFAPGELAAPINALMDLWVPIDIRRSGPLSLAATTAAEVADAQWDAFLVISTEQDAAELAVLAAAAVRRQV